MKVKYNYVEFEKPIIILFNDKKGDTKELENIVSKYNFIEIVLTKSNVLGLDIQQDEEDLVVYKYGKKVENVKSIKSLRKFLKKASFKNKINILFNIACCNKKKTAFRMSRKIQATQTNNPTLFKKLIKPKTSSVSTTSSEDESSYDDSVQHDDSVHHDTEIDYSSETPFDDQHVHYLSSSFEYVYKK